MISRRGGVRPSIVPDPVLGPLLERLALLESANYRLRNSLTERGFNIEVKNSALSEQLARAKEELARHQQMLENLCGELLAAAQARDRAQAEAAESLKIRSEAVAERDVLRQDVDGLRLQLEDVQKAGAEAEARAARSLHALEEYIRAAQAAADESVQIREEAIAQRDSLRARLDDALKAGAEAEARGAQGRQALEEMLRAAQAAADEGFKLRAETASQRDGLRQQLEEALKAGAAAQARGEEGRRSLEEFVRAAQATVEDGLRIRAHLVTQRDGLRFQLEGALKARAALAAQRDALRAQLDDAVKTGEKAGAEGLKAREELAAQRDVLRRQVVDLTSERDGLRAQLDDALKASSDANARGLSTHSSLAAQRDMLRLQLDDAQKAGANAEQESLKIRAELASQCDDLRRELARYRALARKDESGEEPVVSYPTLELALDPGWAKLLRLVKPPLQAAYGHLRRLSAGPMSAGQRAILRLTGSSLSQAADSLATIELALADSPASTETAPVLPALESALASWESVLRRRGIKLELELSRTLPPSPHDPEQLRLALHHVLRNAVEALPRGATLRVRLGKSSADAVRLEFHDDGPGYPPEWLARRFEPFASPRPGHAGLGLAAVRRALRRWGGDAAAAAVEGSGASLTLTFAAAPSRPAAKT